MFFLRHGQTVVGDGFTGHHDVSLTEMGRQAMFDAVNMLHPTQIVSSPLKRCALIAQVLAERWRIELTIDRRWIEYDFGHWTGQTAAEVYEHSPDELAMFWENPEANSPPGGETLSDFATRIKAAVHDLPEGALVVSHGGPGRLLKVWSNDLSIQKIAEQSVALAECFSVDPLRIPK